MCVCVCVCVCVGGGGWYKERKKLRDKHHHGGIS